MAKKAGKAKTKGVAKQPKITRDYVKAASRGDRKNLAKLGKVSDG